MVIAAIIIMYFHVDIGCSFAQIRGLRLTYIHLIVQCKLQLVHQYEVHGGIWLWLDVCCAGRWTSEAGFPLDLDLL